MEDDTKQLQAGQLWLAVQRGKSNAVFVHKRELEDRPLEQDTGDLIQDFKDIEQWVMMVTGYTREELEVFADKAEDLNQEVAFAERQAGWDPTP